MRGALVLAVLALAGSFAGCATPASPAPDLDGAAERLQTASLPACRAEDLAPGAEGDLTVGDVRLLTFSLDAPARLAASVYTTHGEPHVALVSAAAGCDGDRATVPADREAAGRTLRLAATLQPGDYAFAVTCAPEGPRVCGFALEARMEAER